MEDQLLGRLNKDLQDQFQKDKARRDDRDELRRLSHIENDDLLDKLLDQNINPTTMASLMLAPLVLVAWAKGEVHKKEREAIMKAVEEKGLDPFHSAYQLLQGWLEVTPGPKLFATWKSQLQDLKNNLDEESFESLKKDILAHAKGIAETTGGFLGFGNRISKEEQAELDRLNEAFEGSH